MTTKTKKLNKNKEEVLENNTPEIAPNEVEDSDKEEVLENDTPEDDFVDVVSGPRYVRTYSKTDHGKEYKKLAEQFISKPEYAKRAYSLKKPGEIKKLTVIYREAQNFELNLKKGPDETKLEEGPMQDKQRDFSERKLALVFFADKNKERERASILYS